MQVAERGALDRRIGGNTRRLREQRPRQAAQPAAGYQCGQVELVSLQGPAMRGHRVALGRQLQRTGAAALAWQATQSPRKGTA